MIGGKSAKRKRPAPADDEVTTVDNMWKTTDKEKSSIDRWKLGKHKRCEVDDEVVSEKKRNIISIKSPLPEVTRPSPCSSFRSSPESNDEKKKTKHLFVCCSSSTSNSDIPNSSSSANWYRIDPSKSSPTDANGEMQFIRGDDDCHRICGEVVVSEISSSQMIPTYVTPVALGSQIYIIGGWDKQQSEATNHVSCLETTTAEPFVYHQKSHSRMHAKRCLPRPVSTHGKIYVFGSRCGGSSIPNPWAEVFDPLLNLWSPLPEPPFRVIDSSRSSLSFTAVVDNKILLRMGHTAGLLSFDVVTNLWEWVTTPLSYSTCWADDPLTFDGVLYMFSRGQVMAYDLAEQKWFGKPVQGLGIRKCSTLRPNDLIGYVFDVGNNSLCVLWKDGRRVISSCVRCIKFRVARGKDSRGRSILRAHIQSRASYCLSGKFEHSLAL